MPSVAKKQSEPVKIQLRKNDQVKVMSGRDKGKTGRVLSVDAIKKQVTVEHANIIKRHTRPNPQKNIKGGIVEKEAGINVSNVMVVTSGGIATRIGYKLESLPGGGVRRVRVARKTGETLDKG